MFRTRDMIQKQGARSLTDYVTCKYDEFVCNGK